MHRFRNIICLSFKIITVFSISKYWVKDGSLSFVLCESRFFFIYTGLFWSLPGRYLQLPSTTKIAKNLKSVYSGLPRSLPQLPATTKIVHISKSVYWVANYRQLPSATKILQNGRKVCIHGSYLASPNPNYLICKLCG